MGERLTRVGLIDALERGGHVNTGDIGRHGVPVSHVYDASGTHLGTATRRSFDAAIRALGGRGAFTLDRVGVQLTRWRLRR